MIEPLRRYARCCSQLTASSFLRRAPSHSLFGVLQSLPAWTVLPCEIQSGKAGQVTNKLANKGNRKTVYEEGPGKEPINFADILCSAPNE